jgi:hypothetical protein
MPKTWGYVDIRDTYCSNGCRANPCNIEPVNASVLTAMPKSLKARARMAGQQHAAGKTVIPVGNSRKSPYLWGPWLVITGFYFESQESRQLFQKATWLLRSSLGETTVTAHGGFGVLRDMEIAFHAGIRGDNTFMGGRQFLASSQLFCPTCFRSITTLLYAAACSGLVHCWR